MKKTVYTIVLFIIVIFSSAGVSYPDYKITQITNNSYNDQIPRINDNGDVIWIGYDGNIPDIFLYDGTKIKQITDDSNAGGSHQINDSGYVVWSGDDGNDSEIFLYDGTTIKQITDDSSKYHDRVPQINNNGYVAWTGYDDNEDEIFLYDGTSTIQISDNSYNDYSPQINNNGYVVWNGSGGNDYDLTYWEVFLYNGTTIKQITDDSVFNADPKINDNGDVVWAEYGPGNDSEIFLYDGTSIIQITNNDYTDGNPQINDNGYVVWESHHYPDDSEIFLYDGTSTIQITNNSYDDRSPQINSSGYVVWSGYDDNDYEIFLYDGTSIIQITNNSYNDSGQLNDNGYVVWSGYDGNDDEIYLFKYEDYVAARASSKVDLFVTRFYQQCLGREPEKAGLDYWVDALLMGYKAGADVAWGFTFSREFVDRNFSNRDFVDILYHAFFGREPDQVGKDYWLDKLVNSFSRQFVLSGFIFSPEFANLCDNYGIIPTTTSSDQIESFVVRFYQKCLSREPDQGGLQGWAYSLRNGTKTGSEVAQGFIFSQEFITRDTIDSEYVTILYNVFFNRDPDEAGLLDWVDRLKSGESREDVLNGFIYSQEFEDLCNSYGIVPYPV